MADLGWSWLAAPYIAGTVVIVAVTVVAALVRGDRVLRLGVIATSTSALVWCMCHALAASTTDPVLATHLLRLGQGPISLIGPNLMLVLLGVSGQLERYRWTARVAAAFGAVALVIAWATDWVVPGVQVVASGMFYIAPGPLTGLHFSQLAIWLVVGLWLARRATPRSERRQSYRLLIVLVAITTIGTLDTLLLYGMGVYPVAWLVACTAGSIGLYLMLRTDILRPQGLDGGVALELVMFLVTAVFVAGFALLVGPSSALPFAALSAIAWTLVTGLAWAVARARPVRIKGERELDRFIARVPAFDDAAKIDERLSALWREAVGMQVISLWWRDGDALTTHDGRRWHIEPPVTEWLVQNADPLAIIDLGTMRLGAMRAKIEALGTAHNADMIVPLCDRDELVGIAEARFDKALREAERGLVAESARAAARALTFVELARVASRQRATAREIEVADALRLQASASREASLGRWAVAGEYRTAPRTTGAGWSAIELADGRLALLVTEAQAHGVAAALATAAITGAFAAATAGKSAASLDDMIRTMRASSEGVMRGGEPVAAFLAIVDAAAHKIEWACAGHPGGFLIGPVADHTSPTSSVNLSPPTATPLSGGSRVRGASLHAAVRGEAPYPPDMLLVVASTALRGEDDAKWRQTLVELAPTSGRLASVLVETAVKGGEPAEDLLAVVVRSR